MPRFHLIQVGTNALFPPDQVDANAPFPPDQVGTNALFPPDQVDANAPFPPDQRRSTGSALPHLIRYYTIPDQVLPNT